MPPDVAKRVRKAEFEQEMHAMELATKYAERHERRWKTAQKLSAEMLLAAMQGKKLRFGDPCDDDQIAKVLNHAVACGDELEAQTFFDKARRLWRDGVTPES